MEARGSGAIWATTVLAGLLAACAADERPPPVEPAGRGISATWASVGGGAASSDAPPPLAGIDTGEVPIDGFLEGTLGGVRVSGTPYRMEASVTADRAAVRAFVEGDFGEGMVAIDVVGGLDHERLAGGRACTFDGPEVPGAPRELEPTSPGGLAVNAIGCSGPRAMAWDWDRPASTITIRVDALPGGDQRRVEIDVQYGAGATPEGHVTGWIALGR